jgi:hypothetical protein
METWYPKAKRLPITTREYYVERTVPLLSIVEHITAGRDSRDWLQHANNQSSVTFLIRVEGGKGVVYQFMPLEWTPWGNGRFSRGNPHMPKWIKDIINRAPSDGAASRQILMSTVPIEHEGVSPSEGLYTGPMLEASLELNAWIARTVPTIKRDRDHIIGHYQVDHVQRPFCPGGTGGSMFPFDKVLRAVQGEPQPAPQPRPEPAPTSMYFPETDRWVSHGFLGYYNKNGGLVQFGFPKTREFKQTLQDGREYTVQYFERDGLAWRPGEPVVRILVGSMLVDQLKAAGVIPADA